MQLKRLLKLSVFHIYNCPVQSEPYHNKSIYACGSSLFSYLNKDPLLLKELSQRDEKPFNKDNSICNS